MKVSCGRVVSYIVELQSAAAFRAGLRAYLGNALVACSCPGFDFKGDRQWTNNLPGRSERLPVVTMVAFDTSRLELMLQNAADHSYPIPTYLFDPSARLTLLKFFSERWCKALRAAQAVDHTAMCVLNACEFAGC